MKRKRLYKQMLHEAHMLYEDFALNKARQLALKLIFLWPEEPDPYIILTQIENQLLDEPVWEWWYVEERKRLIEHSGVIFGDSTGVYFSEKKIFIITQEKKLEGPGVRKDKSLVQYGLELDGDEKES